MVSPTPYPEVNEVVNELFNAAKGILDGQFVGLYLFGSLTTGTFDSASDVDILFVTQEIVSSELFEALKNMHVRIADMDAWCATQLEVSYIPQKSVRRFDPNDKLFPRLDRGRGESLYWMSHDSDWVVQRHLVREKGIIVEGPSPKVLIDPISPDELREAMRPVLWDWLAHMPEHPEQVTHRGYQSYIVLTVCRVLFTLQHGEVTSKPEAADWAKEALDKHWTPLIERAWVSRQHAGMEADPDELNETMEFIRYALKFNPGINKMMMSPTPYLEVNHVLDELLASAKSALGGQFVGMYLYGSLSSGDFNLETSDVDFLVVTESELQMEKIAELERLHQRLWASGLKWASKLEGAYISKQTIRRHDPSSPPCPTVNEGQFYLGGIGNDWVIQRSILRECGVVVAGPPPKTLIDPVTSDEIHAAVILLLKEWWEPMLEHPAWLEERGPEYKVYAVLSMCRALYTLKHKVISSKPISARWAMTELDQPWKSLIEDAILWRYGLQWKHSLKETLELIRYTLSTTENLGEVR